jgi:transcriptional regulator with XRE-family HTH domain
VASANSGPLIPRRRLGAAFRELREARGETLQQTAKALMFSPSKLSRIENGLAGEPHPRDVRDLIAHFGLARSPQAARLEELAEAGRRPGWWQVPPYRMPARLDMLIAYESAASRIEAYQSTVAPGLLQTPDYARETIARVLPHLTPAEVEHQVEIRIERQRRLRGGQDPPTQVYVAPETILHRQVGTPKVMHDQLTALLEAYDDPHVDLHIIPFSAGIYEAVEMGLVTIYRFADGADSDIVCIERYQYTEFLDRPATISKYRRVIERLEKFRLDRDESRAFIERIQGEKWQAR